MYCARGGYIEQGSSINVLIRTHDNPGATEKKLLIFVSEKTVTFDAGFVIMSAPFKI